MDYPGRREKRFPEFSLTILNQGYEVGARRITVSTVGVVPGILELADREDAVVGG